MLAISMYIQLSYLTKNKERISKLPLGNSWQVRFVNISGKFEIATSHLNHFFKDADLLRTILIR